MKTAIIATAGLWMFGQVMSDVPSISNIAQIGSTSLLFFLFGWLMTKELPRERAKAGEERKASRESTERIVSQVCATFDTSIATMMAEQRDDRERFATEMKSVSEELGRCRFRNEGV